ncbi:M13 family metallopeptidase [Pseudoduganella sp. LjRoot289]|uniref:M13 family metallopeptidase n=1 Tax=Pseudoduganella sp. LjRoot289 TaxID=3342314 RepID=UPI003ECE712D
MRKFAPLLLAASIGTAFAQTPDAPLAALPYTPGLDVTAMDRSADPCQDFYQYSCGGWMRNNPIPADQSAWSVYGKAALDNQRFLWGILATLAKGGPERNAAQQKIGDYFAACMDEQAVNARGAAPVQPYLDLIAGMTSKQDLPRVLAKLHLEIANGMLFGFSSNQDLGDSAQVIAFATNADAGLPDRDYYIKNDGKSKTMRAKYVEHIARMLELAGDAPAAARRAAGSVLRFETALAKASLSRVDQRDPYKLFHKTGLKGVQAMTPAFAWTEYLHAMGLDGLDFFNVNEPAYMRALNKGLQQLSLDDIKVYLRWHTTRAMAPFMSEAFVGENFGFYKKTLLGVPEQKPRWKRCVQLVDQQLGEALGQEFVNRAFSPELKEKTLHMTRQIEAAMEQDINALAWMSEKTKEKAREKLHAVANKIGYPDVWRDYGSYQVLRDDFAGNVVRGTVFEVRRQLDKIGKPLDRAEWGMTPPTVNAYYNPQMNDINFPAGVLQPPLFDAKMDDAPNYGNTGGTIGHELIHGFDDEGRQFDAKGNLKDWWAKQDAKAFNQRAQCIVDQYAQYTIVDDIKINSKLTLGEDAADLGGLVLAWMAWKTEIAGKVLADRDGLTPEQRFFVGTAQWTCENERPEALRVNALTNPHSPGKYRINGVVVNMPEFARAFSCKPGQPMVKPKEKVCRVW